MTEPLDPFIPDKQCSDTTQRLLLYSSCVAKPLQHYLSSRYGSKLAIDILLVHAMEQSGIKSLERYKDVIQRSSFIAANIYSPRFGDLGLGMMNELKRTEFPIITWVPPNFAAFWPVVEGFGEHGVTEMMRSGSTKSKIGDSIMSHKFNPMFEVRFQEQLSRLRGLEQKCYIKTADFIEKNHKNKKLWFTVNHPTYNTVSWMGSQIAKTIGLSGESEEQCLSYKGDETGTWNSFPETRYEFDHFGFSYPMKHASTPHYGGLEFYVSVANKIFDRITTTGK